VNTVLCTQKYSPSVQVVHICTLYSISAHESIRVCVSVPKYSSSDLVEGGRDLRGGGEVGRRGGWGKGTSYFPYFLAAGGWLEELELRLALRLWALQKKVKFIII
jgi:hypothetical protein